MRLGLAQGTENLQGTWDGSPAVSKEVAVRVVVTVVFRRSRFCDVDSNIGMAVLNGTLLGQPTILIVQEFGRPAENVVKSANSPPPAAAVQPVAPTSQQVTTNPVTAVSLPQTQGVAVPATTHVLIDSFSFTKVLSISILGFIALLLMIDMYVLRRRQVVRLSSNHWAHFALIGVAASAIINSVAGSIL